MPEIKVQVFRGSSVSSSLPRGQRGLSVATTPAPPVSVIFSLCLNVLWTDVTGPL